MRTKLILKAYIQKCSDPKVNITALTRLLGEEDLNIPLLKFVEKTIREREQKERQKIPSFSLPSLKGDIEAAVSAEAKERSAHVKLSILTSSPSSSPSSETPSLVTPFSSPSSEQDIPSSAPATPSPVPGKDEPRR